MIHVCVHVCENELAEHPDPVGQEAIRDMRRIVVLFLLVCAARVERPPPGWERRDGGGWDHTYYAHVPEWSIVDPSDDAPASEPGRWVLSAGWRRRGDGFVDEVTGDTSDAWPIAFQNEASFKAHYMGLVRGVDSALRAHWPLVQRLANGTAADADARRSARELPLEFVEAALRVTKSAFGSLFFCKREPLSARLRPANAQGPRSRRRAASERVSVRRGFRKSTRDLGVPVGKPRKVAENRAPALLNEKGGMAGSPAEAESMARLVGATRAHRLLCTHTGLFFITY